ncbi:PRA1 family protein F4 [Bienertia sinuspersici]
MSRIRRNLNYFRFNYSLFILITLFHSLLWHPFSMIVFLLLFLLWIFLYFSRDESIFVYYHSIYDRFVLLALTIVTVLALAFTNVGFNVLISLIVGFSVVVYMLLFEVLMICS